MNGEAWRPDRQKYSTPTLKAMKLIRYTHTLDPYRELEAFFTNPFRSLAPLLPSPQLPDLGVEWFEDDSHYHARIEVPGVKKEALRLDAEQGLLRLSFESAETSEDGTTTRRSRSERVIRCPEGVRGEGIEARLSDGILLVSLPKEEARKPVRVEIN